MNFNPHDHQIDWSKGFPSLSPPNNYPNGEAPSFYDFVQGIIEGIIESTGGNSEKMMELYNPEDHKFETLGEFKIYLSSGANVGFEYNGAEYGIEGHNNNFYIWNEKNILKNNITLEEVLDFKLDGVKIRDLILKAEITERIL